MRLRGIRGGQGKLAAAFRSARIRLGLLLLACALVGLASPRGAAAAPVVFPAISAGTQTDTTATVTFFAFGDVVDYDWHLEYGTDPGSLDQSAPGTDTIEAGTQATHSITLTGLTPGTTYFARAVATGPLGEIVPGGVSPPFTTLTACAAGHCLLVADAHATNESADAADVIVQIDSAGSETQWHVEWRSGSESGFPHASSVQTIAASDPHPLYVSLHLSGLSPSTTYQARVVASNALGQSGESDAFTFATRDACDFGACPVLFPSSVLFVTDTSATLVGHVGTQGAPADVHFEYGTSGYTEQTPTRSLPGSSSDATELQEPLTGLEPGTTYHFRVVATNATGTRTGDDETFATADACSFGHCATISGLGAVPAERAATVFATVGTGGFDTTWSVEWWADGDATHQTAAGGTILGGLGSQNVSLELSSLDPRTTYHFALHATGANGTTTLESTFATLDPCDLGHCPDIAPSLVSEITDTGALVTGFIGTRGIPTDWTLELGLEGAGFTSSPAGGHLDGTTAGSDILMPTLSGLVPSTAYQLRFVATNENGVVYGPTEHFTTASACDFDHCATVDADAIQVGPHEATLVATVGTGSFDTTWSAEIWTDAAPTPLVVGNGAVPGGAGSETVSVPLTALLARTTYHWRVVAENENGLVAQQGDFATLDPCALGQCADPREPTVADVTDTAAYVFGFVGTGNRDTGWTLELAAGDAPFAPAATGTLPASLLGASPIEVPLTGLQPQTLYHVRIVADNGEGPVEGPETTFFTGDACSFGRCPEADVQPAVERGTRVVLAGSIDTKDSPTSWTIEWGTTVAYGSTFEGVPLVAANGGSSPIDDVELTGLTPSTTYHYRVVATNAWGTTEGDDQTFATSAPFVNTDSIQWQSGPDLPRRWSGFTAASLDGTMLVTGRDLASRVYAFDPFHGQDEFTQLASPAPYTTTEESSAVLDGKLWVMSVGVPVGGGGSPQRVTEVYDPATETWSLGPVIENEDTLSIIHPALAVSGNTLYAFNGRGVPGPGRDHIYEGAWKLNDDRTAWSAITPPPVPVADPGIATASDGRIFLFGGVTCDSVGAQPWFRSCLAGNPTTLVQVYDPADDSWSEAAPMPTPRYSLTAFRAGCAIYAIGGLERQSVDPPDPSDPVDFGPSLRTVEVYNPVDDRWIPAPDMQEARADFAAAFVDHQVWVLGGGPIDETSSTEYLTPAVIASAQVAPASPDGDNGWYTTAPTVTVDACGGIGGPASLVYGFGSTSGHPYAGAPQTVTAPEGVSTFTYGAFDHDDNAAVEASRALKVDTTDPTAGFDSFAGDAYRFAVADTGSGVDRVVFTANTPAGPVALGTQTSGFAVPRSSLPAGTTSIGATAFDAAGNQTTFTQPAQSPTSLTVPPVSADFLSAATLSATLTSDSAPVAGESVTLTVGSLSCSGVTAANGEASCSVTVDLTPGSYPIAASFSGSGAYLPSSGSGTLTVTGEPTELLVTPAFGVYGRPTLLWALLTSHSHPVSGGSVTLTAGGESCTDTTTVFGIAVCAIPGTNPPGPVPLTGSFAGAPGYLPSTGSNTLTVQKIPTLLSITSAAAQPTGTVTVTAKLRDDDGTPVAGAPVALTVGSSTVTLTSAADGTVSRQLTLQPGSYAVHAAYAGSAVRTSSSDDGALVAYRDSHFVVWGGARTGGGDGGPAVGDRVVFWGSQWYKQVAGHDYGAGNSFKGYADDVAGSGWSTRPGNASSPPSAIDGYISLIVSDRISKSRSTISGNVIGHVVVAVDQPGRYRPNPGHEATGVVVALLP